MCRTSQTISYTAAAILRTTAYSKVPQFVAQSKTNNINTIRTCKRTFKQNTNYTQQKQLMITKFVAAKSAHICNGNASIS